MAIIDNKNITMQETLRAALKTADSIDISVAFFYFNGLELLTNELLDKKIRLMVGMEIQPDLIPFIVKESKDKPVDISKYQVRPSLSSSLAKKNNFEEVLIGLINDSDIFDESSIADVLDLFLKKIENGTFEIRKNDSFDHSKFYIAHDKELNSERKQTGTVIMGSANFTYKGCQPISYFSNCLHQDLIFTRANSTVSALDICSRTSGCPLKKNTSSLIALSVPNSPETSLDVCTEGSYPKNWIKSLSLVFSNGPRSSM